MITTNLHTYELDAEYSEYNPFTRTTFYITIVNETENYSTFKMELYGEYGLIFTTTERKRTHYFNSSSYSDSDSSEDDEEVIYSFIANGKGKFMPTSNEFYRMAGDASSDTRKISGHKVLEDFMDAKDKKNQLNSFRFRHQRYLMKLHFDEDEQRKKTLDDRYEVLIFEDEVED